MITNNLIKETSPYLLQHAQNPVNWFAWNNETLAKAKKENKLLLVSIGYSSCHWCHVMEHESFEDEATATIMNQHFITIKVDREERPDIDQTLSRSLPADEPASRRMAYFHLFNTRTKTLLLRHLHT